MAAVQGTLAVLRGRLRVAVQAKQRVIRAGAVVARGGPPRALSQRWSLVREVTGRVLEALGQTQVLIISEVCTVLAEVPAPALPHPQHSLQQGVKASQIHRQYFRGRTDPAYVLHANEKDVRS